MVEMFPPYGSREDDKLTKTLFFKFSAFLPLSSKMLDVI